MTNDYRLTRPEILLWTDMNSIKNTFRKLGFNDIDDSNPNSIIVAVANPQTLLRIQNLKHGKTSRQNLTNSIRYLLLVDEFKKYTFITSKYNKNGKKTQRSFKFERNYLPDTTITKLRDALKFDDIRAFERLFTTRDIVKTFYAEYARLLRHFSSNITNITDQKDRDHYGQVLMYRMIFCYLLQSKNFLSKDSLYMHRKWHSLDNTNYYRDFLQPLFNALNSEKNRRVRTSHTELSKVPYLNGGLFRKHRIEDQYDNIEIDNAIFGEILNFLENWAWHVDDGESSRGINPEILGYIFENTISERNSKGIYYTPRDVTSFINNSSIIPYCTKKINKTFGTNYPDLNTVIKNGNTEEIRYLYFNVLKKIRILDNSCGSGEFLLSALKVLYEDLMAAWDVIKDCQTKDVVEEKSSMKAHRTPSYHLKREIITQNLYGVDKEEESVEICKLRLWLSLIADIDPDSVDPLPNIDYNILVGNSLLGYVGIPKWKQTTLEHHESSSNILEKLDSMRDAFRDEQTTIRTRHLKQEIDRKTVELSRAFNTLRMNDLHRSSKDKYSGGIDEMVPMHWSLNFWSVMKDGGFDIIVGNPPYIEKRKLGYPVDFLRLHDCGNTYAYFVEMSLSLLKNGGVLGYIVPVSSMSTDRMASLQKLLLDSCSELRLSHYDDRPGKIFEGLEHCRSTIILATKNEQPVCNIYTTGYKRWFTANRKSLFLTHIYEPNTFASVGTIPKIGKEIESSILAKIRSAPQLRLHLRNKSKYKIWYHNAPQYWIRCMYKPSYLKHENRRSISSHVKNICFNDNKSMVVALALLNSSLFYWFFIKTSNCRDFGKREIQSFGIDISKIDSRTFTNLRTLTTHLMDDYMKNSEVKTSIHSTGRVTKREFYPRYSKNIIDQIDAVFAKQYGLTAAEAHYIKTFDEQFRAVMSN